MGFRFFKRMNILPGVTLNLSKGGGSVSVGPRGAKLTVGTSGTRATVGLPGSGLFYTTVLSLKKLGRLFGYSSDSDEREISDSIPQKKARSSSRKTTNTKRKSGAASQARDVLAPEDFDHLDFSDDEKDLAAGCQALVSGDEESALRHFAQATELADGAFLAGVLSLKQERVEAAIHYLIMADQQQKELGQHLFRHDITATLSIPVTEEITAHVGPNVRGVLLALAEAYQGREKFSDAAECLQRLRRLEPEDVVVKLSLAELLMESGTPTRETCQDVVQLTAGIENDSALHAALLLYQAKALRGLGLLDAAQEVLSRIMRKKKDRPKDLLRALRYERALVYEEKMDKSKARAEWESLYAEAPDYEDVKIRLGL